MARGPDGDVADAVAVDVTRGRDRLTHILTVHRPVDREFGTHQVDEERRHARQLVRVDLHVTGKSRSLIGADGERRRAERVLRHRRDRGERLAEIVTVGRALEGRERHTRCTVHDEHATTRGARTRSFRSAHRVIRDTVAGEVADGERRSEKFGAGARVRADDRRGRTREHLHVTRCARSTDDEVADAVRIQVAARRDHGAEPTRRSGGAEVRADGNAGQTVQDAAKALIGVVAGGADDEIVDAVRVHVADIGERRAVVVIASAVGRRPHDRAGRTVDQMHAAVVDDRTVVPTGLADGVVGDTVTRDVAHRAESGAEVGVLLRAEVVARVAGRSDREVDGIRGAATRVGVFDGDREATGLIQERGRNGRGQRRRADVRSCQSRSAELDDATLNTDRIRRAAVEHGARHGERDGRRAGGGVVA